MITTKINDFLDSGQYATTSIHYDMSCLKIRFQNPSNLTAYMLYLYAPWRIVKDGTLVNSSSLYPSEKSYESKKEFRRAFKKFCESTQELQAQKATRIEISPVTNDLTLHWQDGTMLEKFCTSTDWDYHLYDKLQQETYDFCFNSSSAP